MPVLKNILPASTRSSNELKAEELNEQRKESKAKKKKKIIYETKSRQIAIVHKPHSIARAAAQST